MFIVVDHFATTTGVASFLACMPLKLKEINIAKYKHNRLKNSNWWEAD